ncbi:hypothetical protein TREPR_0696 [Treponema primitia ZAS-2]|uniref:FIST C-domain domain-containing protein n=1 Tax=Treponema primitia (strain ATCC BAA-887 / DSM 12427 / ZAS-2) TaxID=545694 RepID=F5YJZ4_TREPZ|nr:FIST C-terminal domain-containing protein [Treponema primitia]AEF86063.1 hypothetical protein TREPR_0696 [Treponema primitia ZAS-2]
MIKTLTAYTNEIDDVEKALGEIFDQLDLGKNLLKNSIGIISCFADFLNSGVVKALVGKLPFDLVGATTLGGSTGGNLGETILILTVLTGDEVEFVTGITDPILEEDEGLFRRAYEKAAGSRKDKPALMLSFAPLLRNVSCDYMVNTFTAISGNVPNFGTQAVDHNSDYHASQTILNGDAFPERYVFVLVYGPLNPSFIIGGISEERVFPEKGLITASQGNQLQTVNGLSVIDYLVSLGLSKDENGSIVGINSFPFVLDYKDGAQPVIRVMFAITPDGYAVCGGNMPVGAILGVGTISAEEVIATTERALKGALQGGKKNGMLIFSCIGRFFAQGFNPTAEMEKVQEVINNGVPFHLGYSGGEICPVYGKDGSIINRNHNDTIVICVF